MKWITRLLCFPSDPRRTGKRCSDTNSNHIYSMQKLDIFLVYLSIAHHASNHSYHCCLQHLVCVRRRADHYRSKMSSRIRMGSSLLRGSYCLTEQVLCFQTYNSAGQSPCYVAGTLAAVCVPGTSEYFFMLDFPS